jgi:transcriptional regulator with XRE-family HTH domain
MTLGEKIAFIREGKGWTQTELGQRIGASRNGVGKYERGEVQPPLPVLIKIAETLSVSLDYLAGIIEQNPSYDKDSIPRELVLLLTKIEKLPKSDKNHIEAVVDAFSKAQLNSAK